MDISSEDYRKSRVPARFLEWSYSYADSPFAKGTSCSENFSQKIRVLALYSSEEGVLMDGNLSLDLWEPRAPNLRFMEKWGQVKDRLLVE